MKTDWDRIVRIKTILSEKCMTGKDLAAKTKMREEFVSMIILGRRRTKWREERIAIALGYKWAELFGDKIKVS